MRSRSWVRLRSPIIVAMATSRRGGLIHRSTWNQSPSGAQAKLLVRTYYVACV